MENHHKPLEITQQQISLLAAAILMIAFFSFLAGYLSMPDRSAVVAASVTVTHEACSTRHRAGFGGQPLPLYDRGSVSHEPAQTRDDHTPSGEAETPIGEKNDEEYYAVATGFGTVEAARTFKERFTALGITTQIVPLQSTTVAGMQRTLYQLATTYGMKQQIEYKARIMQRIVPTVVIECAKKKKGIPDD